jgi:hypothetical protein
MMDIATRRGAPFTIENGRLSALWAMITTGFRHADY